jgi:hypothetical protein
MGIPLLHPRNVCKEAFFFFQGTVALKLMQAFFKKSWVLGIVRACTLVDLILSWNV